MSYPQLAQTLAESFSALADEVQSLIDRKTILEHKLRFAHEQYQVLADKYAPGAPDVSETLAKLQLPPDLRPHLPDNSTTVPLPRRQQPGNTQHQIALLIREGRKASQQLVAAVNRDRASGSSKETSLSPTTEAMTSTSTVLEQDFTVEGRKGSLACPFSSTQETMHAQDAVMETNGMGDLTGAPADPTPHNSSDPICAAMLEDAPAASKCPIRFLDKHPPEEIARYVEAHKHEIPRSHEVCVRRYQKNEDQIRKLDAKYGNLVSMINDLSQLHRPMLPTADEGGEAVDRSSNQRVENWAQAVTPTDPEQPGEAPSEEERQSHFDRPLRDVRVGESPSRPWGISVPPGAAFHAGERPASPPPAPVMHSPPRTPNEPNGARKCPFDHTKFAFPPSLPNMGGPSNEGPLDYGVEHQGPAFKGGIPPVGPSQPTFVNPADMDLPKTEKGSTPQMVFNISGPVFIGYPMDQAIEFMRRYQGQ
ncbi:hypothetical protein QBC47DRAFT_382247 [Echria macrotheca]|uniref:Uncharacterized protein n=1 Tax=Echria macrotheca TaxID=438768 RepID=A0AAJ0BAZ8_9PEZI|nr:hypothetical protein QBC47DRAFT_382247 [Echria macrotheca]